MNEPPTFTSTPSNLQALLSHKAEFTCHARGVPLPEITWFLEDAAIISTDSCIVKTTESSEDCEVESKLCLSNVAFTNENLRYHVEAENSIGKYASHEFALIGEVLL